MTTRELGAWPPGPIRYQKKPEIASRPRPATSMPVIAPERKAMVRPPCSEVRAASAVRTLAFTETFMPTKPVTPESTAPSRKPTAEMSAEEVEDDAGDDDADDRDGEVLAVQIGAGAFLHGGGDVLHPLVAGGRLQHLHGGDAAIEHGEQAAGDGDEHNGHDLPLILHESERDAAEAARPKDEALYGG